MLTTRLLPYRWKIAGMVLAFAGTISAIIYIFFDISFKVKVFAVYSSFLATKYFTTFKTNFFDELTLLLLISGLALIVFSKEKNETEGLDAIRYKALAKALIANTIFLFLSVLFVYGSGFIAILAVNIVSPFIFYLCFFYLRKYRNSNIILLILLFMGQAGTRLCAQEDDRGYIVEAGQTAPDFTVTSTDKFCFVLSLCYIKNRYNPVADYRQGHNLN